MSSQPSSHSSPHGHNLASAVPSYISRVIRIRASKEHMSEAVFRDDFITADDEGNAVLIETIGLYEDNAAAGAYLHWDEVDQRVEKMINPFVFETDEHYAQRLMEFKTLDHFEEGEAYRDYCLVKGQRGTYLFKGLLSGARWSAVPLTALYQEKAPQHYAVVDMLRAGEAVCFKMSPSANIVVKSVSGVYLKSAGIAEDVVSQVFVADHRNL